MSHENLVLIGLATTLGVLLGHATSRLIYRGDGIMIKDLNEIREASRERLFTIVEGSKVVSVYIKYMFDPGLKEIQVSSQSPAKVAIPFPDISMYSRLELSIRDAKFLLEVVSDRIELRRDVGGYEGDGEKVAAYDLERDFYILVFKIGNGYRVFITPSILNYEEYQKEPLPS